MLNLTASLVLSPRWDLKVTNALKEGKGMDLKSFQTLFLSLGMANTGPSVLPRANSFHHFTEKQDHTTKRKLAEHAQPKRAFTTLTEED